MVCVHSNLHHVSSLNESRAAGFGIPAKHDFHWLLQLLTYRMFGFIQDVLTCVWSLNIVVGIHLVELSLD